MIEHNPPIQYQYNNSNSEINQLKEELIKYKNIVEEQKIMIINLKENLNNMNNTLKAKDEEIKNLKKTELQKENLITKLNNSIINSNNINYFRNQIRAVLIKCEVLDISFAIPCLGSDKFSLIEQKVYQLLNNTKKKYCFLKSGRSLESSDIIDSYKIGDGRPVLMMQNLASSMVSNSNQNP